MAEENGVVKEICQTFLPQKWRKTKCQTCFKDMIDHTKHFSTEESGIYIKQCMKFDNNEPHDTTTITSTNIDGLPHTVGDSFVIQNNIKEKNILASTSTIVGDNLLCYNSESNFVDRISKQEGSSEQLDVEGEIGNMKDSDNDDETADEGSNTPYSRRRKKRQHSPLFSLEHMDSHDAEDGSITPNRMSQKRRSRSKGKNNSNLLSLSAMMLSSNSSLCSYTSELTDGYSDYDYDIRSITDDTDDYAELPDELDIIKPELKARVENERRVSRSRIISLERELEGQQDYYRASEVAKDRQLKTLQRDIEGLKLELSSVKAHENILALKSRLELEGKNNRIYELEQQIEDLKDEITEVSKAPDTYEAQHELLSKELCRVRKWNVQLEEENRRCEERMKLAEDLQHNDKEWIDMLQKQCSSLEADLITEQERNSQLEDKVKMLELIRGDFLKEQEKHVKTSKELEEVRQRVKRRERDIEDLEVDNIKMQQLKKEIESNLTKKEFKLKKLEKKITDLQNEVIDCNKEIADLTGENKTLEQVKRLTDLKLKDMSSIAQTTEVATNEQFFINTLEDRLRHRESRLKELELQNDNYLREIKELHVNLLDVEKQREECKEQIKDNEIRISQLRQEGKHSEKKIELLRRKLQKSEKEKRRALNRQNNAEIKLSQYQQEQESVIAATSRFDTNEPTPYDSSEDGDSRILKLKLQSTEARLSMIEVNKGYLESKVVTLERKLIDKEQEIYRLNDSMERDSGAPSQDYDRFDALERENIMLQTKLDELSLENDEQKGMVNKLKEGNQHLETTIQNLNNKLESCTYRLKDLEEANHKLGREALKRNETYNHTQDEVTSSLNELREHNDVLQKKLSHFDNLEDVIEQLDQQVKTEKSYVQLYFDENEKLKIQTAKMADTIRTLERHKFEFEQSVRELSDTNKDLDNDVKRLEQKLEIYTELFDKDSSFHSSLKRRSLQTTDHQEQADEKLIENALAPLMEEIKEKDAQIRNLQKAVEEKEIIVNSLNKEIDTLETNLADMVTEKIRNMHISNDPDSEKVRNGGGLFSYDSLNELKHNHHTTTHANTHIQQNTNSTTALHIDDNQTIRIGEPCTLLLSTGEVAHDQGAPSLTHTSSEPSSPRQTYMALTSKTLSNSSTPQQQTQTTTGRKELAAQLSISTSSSDALSPKTSPHSVVSDDELSLTRQDFYRLLQEHEDCIKKKDERQHVTTYRDVSPTRLQTVTTSGSIYRTIESAILDQYRGDEHHSNLTSNMPSLDDNRRIGGSPPYMSFMEAAATAADLHFSHVTTNEVDNKSMSNIAENKKLVDDMYDQLAQLEDLVAEKYSQKIVDVGSSGSGIAAADMSSAQEKHSRDILSQVESGSGSEQDICSSDISPPLPSPVESISPKRAPKVCRRQSSRESSLGLPSNATLLCRTPSTSSTLSQDSSTIDFSGLDELLVEVDQKGSHEKYNIVVQETKRRAASGLEHKPVVSKTMPSLRTTRRIIKFGGLNRTGSFDSTRTKPKIISSSGIISHSSSNIPATFQHRNVNVEIPASRLKDTNTSTSSLPTASTSTSTSIVYVPDKDGHVTIPPGSPSSSSPPSSATSSAPTVTTSSSSTTNNKLVKPTSSTSSLPSPGATPPFRRPKLESCRFFSSTSSIGGGSSKPE